MLLWADNVDLQMQIEMLEVFSGRARIAEVFRSAGRAAVAYDALYDSSGSAMNFASPGGFSLTAQLLLCMLRSRCLAATASGHALIMLLVASKASHDLCFERGPECLQHVGPDLLQLVYHKSRTSLRSAINPGGRDSLDYVQEGTLTLSRLGPR